MRRAHRIDINQPLIFDTFRMLHCLVVDTSALGDGKPDCYICTFEGSWAAVEIKQPGEKLTPDEAIFHQTCRMGGAPIYIIRTPEDVIKLVGEMQ